MTVFHLHVEEFGLQVSFKLYNFIYTHIVIERQRRTERPWCGMQ